MFHGEQHQQHDDDHHQLAYEDEEKEDDDPEHCGLYAILNLPRNYDASTFQSQSRSLLRAFHPDKAATDDVQPTFLQIKLAIDTLSDPIMKEAYDYGGLMAVQIIKNQANLYHLLADRTARDDRLAILELVLTESHQARQRSTRPQWMTNSIQISVNAPIYLASSSTTTPVEHNSLFVTWTQNITRHIRASLTSHGLINFDFSSLLSVTLGKQLLFHASRVLSDDSHSVVKFTAGRGTAAVRSMRNMMQGTLFTVWGVDLRAGAGGTATIQSLMMSVQKDVWKIRLAVADYFVKVSTTKWGWHGSLAWGIYGARYKLVRSYHVQDIVVLRYGVKLSPGSPLLPVFYLSTPHLSLRLPVLGAINPSSSLVKRLVTTLLIVEGMESLLGDGTFDSFSLRRNKANEASSSLSEDTIKQLRWHTMVRSVAYRKAKSSRLKILRARFVNSTNNDNDDDRENSVEDCGHWIQFWIDEWASAVVFRPDDPRWEWLPKGPGTIRYSFDGQVFETTVVTRPGTLRLPAPNAQCLGDASIVR